jgi:hypothetical protein
MTWQACTDVMAGRQQRWQQQGIETIEQLDYRKGKSAMEFMVLSLVQG